MEGHKMTEIGSGRAATWLKTRDLVQRPTWRELFNYGEGCCKWLLANKLGDCFTKRDVCLVATLCYHHWDVNTDRDTWTVYHSTIPRIEWFDHLWNDTKKKAPIWHTATRACRKEREVHAEDGAIFGFESEWKEYPEAGQGQEQLRMVVCGVRKGLVTPVIWEICNNCITVAENPVLNIRLIREATSHPSDFDRQDNEQQLVRNIKREQEEIRRQHQHQQQQQQQQQQQSRPSTAGSGGSRPRPGTAGSGGSRSTTYGEVLSFEELAELEDELAKKNKGTSGTPSAKAQRRGAPSSDPIHRLTQGMSGLGLGRGGSAPLPGHPASGGRQFSAQPAAANSSRNPTVIGRPSSALPASMGGNSSTKPTAGKPAGQGAKGGARSSGGLNPNKR
ncbi:hypothetical protein B0I37DRAFT_358851 [Chaetomium sp. MPI-CAGE-AT-0009]|nr:hypothetical protein B0I37DRAFT_358851 [Chaetomium sp. MPI-CAGE-AT-0009]